MSGNIEERYRQFQVMELPGQPRSMHMGTSYLVNDMWAEIKRLRAALEKIAGSSADKLQAIHARNALDNIGASADQSETTNG